jgi:hypothetical protein
MHYVEPITAKDLVKDKGARMLGQFLKPTPWLTDQERKGCCWEVA